GSRALHKILTLSRRVHRAHASRAQESRSLCLLVPCDRPPISQRESWISRALQKAEKMYTSRASSIVPNRPSAQPASRFARPSRVRAPAPESLLESAYKSSGRPVFQVLSALHPQVAAAWDRPFPRSLDRGRRSDPLVL